MFRVRGAFACAFWNFRMLLKNVRFYTGLLLGFLICFFLTEKTISLSHTFGTDLQLFEPFVWSFADGDSILFASLALLLPLSQLPRLDTPASYLIFRAGRLSWLLGQVITVFAVSLFYVFFLLGSTCLLAAGNAFLADHWSNTAVVMSFAPAQFDVALEVVRRTVKQTTPINCALSIFALLTQYVLLLSSINLFFSLRRGKRTGTAAVILFSLICYLLTPDRLIVWLGLEDFRQLHYIANRLLAWISPLQHAAYTMHSFSGYENLPTLGQTCLILGAASLFLLILSFFAAQKTRFLFRKGENHG